MTLRLLTIGPSHYCEKARWALDRAGLAYTERAHPPMLHVWPMRRAARQTSAPVLTTPEGAIGQSSDILRFADRDLPPAARLFPEQPALRDEVETLVADYDRRLGPAVRRVVYFYLFPDAGMFTAISTQGASGFETAVFRALRPAIIALMRRGMKIDEAGVARSDERIDAGFAAVSERLADGRRYLVGDRFTAADLTFAALGAPMIVPPEYGAEMPPLDRLPGPFRARLDRLRDTPAGRLLRRLYAEERARVIGP